MLEIAKHWEDRFEPKSQRHQKNRIAWATPFIKLLRLSDQEKKLKPEAAIVHKNPATKLTNYKKLSQIRPNKDNQGFFFIFFYLYIYPSDSQESDEGAIHRVSNYPDLLPEIPRYCCPLVI